MIKLPKEVNKIMKALESAGFEAFVTGGCVRDTLQGLNPYEWDISTSAGAEDLKNLFPEGKVISEKYGVLRFEYIEEVYEGEEFVGETGIILDVSPYRQGSTIEEDLGRQDFTIDAIADGMYKVVDPYGGRADMKKKLIRTIGNANERLEREPILIIRAIRLAAQLDFDLHKDVYEAIKAHYRLLETVSVDRLRDEFVMLISAAHAGKGLSMIMDTGILNIILGDDVVGRLTKREMSDLTTLCQNIDRSQQVEERRLGLFYTCIDKKKAQPSIDRFNFDEETHEHLIDAINDMAKLYFTAQKPELKKLIYKKGWERYNYMANLEKAQRIVFEYDSETKIRSRMYMIDEIKKFNEPIFPEEIAIDGNDLMEAGICKNEAEVEKMLGMLTEELHVHPKKNTRKDLLELAKKYKKFKFLTWTRGIHWQR